MPIASSFDVGILDPLAQDFCWVDILVFLNLATQRILLQFCAVFLNPLIEKCLQTQRNKKTNKKVAAIFLTSDV
jgi:hypothetical protein